MQFIELVTSNICVSLLFKISASAKSLTHIMHLLLTCPHSPGLRLLHHHSVNSRLPLLAWAHGSCCCSAPVLSLGLSSCRGTERMLWLSPPPLPLQGAGLHDCLAEEAVSGPPTFTRFASAVGPRQHKGHGNSVPGNPRTHPPVAITSTVGEVTQQTSHTHCH